MSEVQLYTTDECDYNLQNDLSTGIYRFPRKSLSQSDTYTVT